MSGKKIQLVRETLMYLLELLKDNDRLSIVLFSGSARRMFPLVRVRADKLPFLQQQIQSIQASGGTDINSGMSYSFEILKQRK